MAKSKHNEYDAARSLSFKNGVLISGRNISVKRGHTDVGIKSWGKIDFLVNHCHYNISFH